MRNRRRARFFRRLVLGFAVALVAVPVAQAAPDEGGAQAQKTYIQGVTDFPSSSAVAADQGGLVVQGESKDGLGVASPTAAVLAGDDKQNVPVGVNYQPATHNQFAYRRALPQDLGPQATVLAGLEAETRDTVASARPVVSGSAQVVSSSDGFDWGDAGIGAGLVFAIMLLGGLAVLATRHVSRPASV